MPPLHLALRVLATLTIVLLACTASATDNQAPQFTSTPYPIADVGHDYRYDAEVADPDGDPVHFQLLEAPAGASLDSIIGELTWTPQSADIGIHALMLEAADPHGAAATQSAELRVLEDFCPIYPIALPRTEIEPLAAGALVDGMERGTGPGNYSWLTWTGAVDAPTLADSLLPPGNSWAYVGPTDPSDTLLEIGDWAQGATGSMNAMPVRTNIDALLGEDIILPVWEDVRQQGSNFDYLVWRFAIVRLTDYRLTGHGWISFEFRGYANCHNDPPAAHDQALETPEDTPLAITLTGEDRDGDAITFELLSQPLHGVLTGGAPDLSYTPSENYNGPDSFTFRVHDGEFWSAPAMVAIDVLPVNDPPLAHDQALQTPEDTPLAITLTGEDRDGDAVTFELLGTTSHGTLTGEAPELLYTSAPDFNGADSFTFRVFDGELWSEPATVAIDVLPVNDPPVAEDRSYTTDQNTPVATPVAATDPDGDPLSYRVVHDPGNGMLRGSAPDFAYAPAPSFHGRDAFLYVASDGQADSNTATVDITVNRTNRPPEIVSVPPPRTNEYDAYRYDIDAIDPDGDTLHYQHDIATPGTDTEPVTGLLQSSMEAVLVSSLRGINHACRIPTDVGVFDPEVVWHWQGPSAQPASSAVYGPVLIGQFTDDTGDGRVDEGDGPDAVFMSTGSGRFLNLVDAASGVEHWSRQINDLAVYGSPAFADVDRDGRPEIFVVAGHNGSQVRAYDADGLERWRAAVPAHSVLDGIARDGIAIADLEGDGSAEIVRGRTILESDGTLRCNGSGDAGGQVDYGWLPAIADIDLDGIQEIVAGRSIYGPDCSIETQLTLAPADGFVAIGNFDEDHFAEIVLVSNGRHSSTGRLWIFDHDGTRQLGPVSFPGGGALGPPTLARVAGSAYPVIGIAGRSHYSVFDHTGALLWSRAVQDHSSHKTGSTSFDFEGDGRAEIIYADELNLRVFDALNGAVRMTVPNGSGTTLEYPIVADANQDGSADIILGSNTTATKGVRMVSSASRAWMPTRSLWNQHAYHVDNIADDGSIPPRPARSWLTHNTFRLNAFPDRDPLGLPDLALFDLALGGDGSVGVQVANRGLAPSAYPTSVRVFNGGLDGGQLLGVLEVPVLAAGESVELTLSPGDHAVSTDLFADIDEPNDVAECDEANNQVAAGYFSVRATDPPGLFDTQRFTVTVENVNEAPTIVTDALPDGHASEAYRFKVMAQDPDLGDGLLFELVASPPGMTIDQVSGELRSPPNSTQGGAHVVTVQVTDLGGLAAKRTFSLFVRANSPPMIITTPLARVEEGDEYEYDIDAADPDGDTLVYAATSAPQNTTLESTSGAVVWPASPGFVEGIRTLNGMCRDPAVAQDALAFEPVRKWSWSRRSALSMPLVGPLRDTNGDGRFDSEDTPTVLINTALGHIDGSAGYLVALDGATGEELWENSTLRTRASATPAIGDLDGDGKPEIVSFTSSGGVAALSHAGVELWRTPHSTVADNSYNYGSIAIYDLEGDGRAEILHHGAVLNHDGSVRWQPALTWNRVPAYAVDVDNDGIQEVAIGERLYSATGALLHTVVDHHGWVLSAPGNFDADPAPEFAFVLGNYYSQSSEIRVLDSDWTTVLWSRVNVEVARGGPPVVSDLDGDGIPDISFIGMARHVAYSGDGRLLWSNPISDRSTGTNGSTSFDFDGDGTHEVVSQDENKVRVFDGRTGRTLFEAQHSSPTAAESPIVADVDGDGHADIVVEGRASNGASVAVYSDVANRWVATRPIWNQYSYHIDNIEDDGGIPAHPVASWRSHNSYRVNSFPDRHARGRVDLALFDLSLQGGGESVGVAVVNRGLAPAAATQVRIYNGDPGLGGMLLGTLEVESLAAGAERRLQLDGVPATAANSNLYARVDEIGAVAECVENNNQTAAAYFAVRATDPHGQFDSQRFTVSVGNVNEAPRVLANDLPVAAVNHAYRVQIAADDPDIGDALRYTLVTAPVGMTLDSLLGELRWTPLAAQVGTHPVSVRVTDLGGLSAELSASIIVLENRSPQITSLPPLRAVAGAEYRYDVEATDADGDSLEYALMHAPDGMEIEGGTGVVTWSRAVAGSHEIEIRVLDSRGSFALQRYSLEVDSGSNRSPSFGSAPPVTASPSRLYTYLADADDPDGDALVFSLTEAPAGMVVDVATGALSWTPAATGTFSVTLRVDDGRGGWAQQQWLITVAADGGSNQPPKIASTPPAEVALGQAYVYGVVASDPDGDPLSVVLTAAPPGMSVIGTSIQWTPVPGQLGTHAVALVVADGRGGQATQSFIVEVLDGEAGDNRPPTISSAPPVQAKATFPYSYAVQAFDADGDLLAWSLTEAPLGMTVDGTGVISWTPAAAGTADVVVRVADAQAWVEQGWTIAIADVGVPLSGRISVMPDPVLPGEPVTIGLEVGGAVGPVAVTATLDGAPLALPPDGTVTVLAPSTPGEHVIEVTIGDGVDTVTVTETFSVGDPSDDTAPTVRLVDPAMHPDFDAVEVTAPTPVTGEVFGDDVVRWTLAVQERGGSAVRVLAEGAEAFPLGTIGDFDPTMLLNGQYHLVLQAWDAAGNTAFDTRILRVTGDMKLGHFSISFEEVSIPVAGIPVMVTRTYDTRRAHQSLDFGHGWTVDANNVRLHESRRPGYGWDVYEEGGLLGKRCIRPMGDPIVTVALPDGELASFRAQALPECHDKVAPNPYVQLVFVPIDGTDHQLEQTSYGTVRWANVAGYPVPILINEIDGDTTPIDPRHYRLTTDDGLVYDIDQVEGVKRVFDSATETSLTYSRDGVLHSSGIGITFVRDDAGRISQMQLPDGEAIDYSYDSTGDLGVVTDPTGATSQFGYIADPRYPHYLEDIVDARGVRVSRNEYDESGRLVATVDADGDRISFEHLIADRIEHVRDRNGNLTIYAYDEQGRVVQETNALGETIQRSYDAEGNQLSETNALGETTSWTYDARGNRLTETNAAGETTTSTWNEKGQLLTQIDAAGVPVVANTFDSRSGLLLTRTEDALGNATSFGYVGGTGIFGSGQLERITDPAGATTQFSYHAATGYVQSETDALGHRTDYVRDSMGRVLEERRTRTLPDGSSEALVTRYTLDAEGRVTATEHPDGSITTTAYDANGNPVEECDALGRCTVTVYDARGNVARIDYSDGTSETKTYDANGNLAGETDRGGRTTLYVYDAANRRVETVHPDDTPATDADSPRTRSEYDGAGRLVRSIDELGRVTTYAYDALGRQIAVTDPMGNTVQTEYDTSGRRSAVVDPAGHRTEYGYDAAGRLFETRHDDGSMERVEYYAAGRKVADIDAMGRTTRYAYDPLGRLVAVVLPDPATGANPPLVDGASPDAGTLTTRYVYDEVGNKIAQLDAEGRETRWEYDAMGRETARILPLGQRETKQHNAAGELVEHTDFNGKTTRYAYDAAGRLAAIDYPNDADVGFGYSASGQRVQVTDGRGTSTAEHDARDRLLLARDADGFDIAYEYDAVGNLTARISPSQSLVYSYDAANRITSVVRSIDGEAPITTTYEYDADGDRSAMLTGDGIRTEYSYDRRHRLTDLVKRTAAGALMAAMTYSVDASGMRTHVVESDAAGTTRVVAWAYDGVKRLVSETIDHRDARNDRQAIWTYDRVGNRLTQSVTMGATSAAITTYGYDANDRLLTEATAGGDTPGTTTYAYDANGNTISRSAPDGTVTYTWDDANRMAAATLPDGAVSYVYNADGLRVRKTHTPLGSTPTTTWFLQDSNYPYAQAIEEYEGAPGTPLQLAATFTFADDLVAQTRYHEPGAPTTHFIHADGLGSSRWLTQQQGQQTDIVEYDAFGLETVRAGNAELEQLHRGESFDAQLGLYNLRARWMDPSIGRFNQTDRWAGRVKDPRTLHKYVYAHGDPIGHWDPTGFYTQEFGYAVEKEVERQYRASHSECGITIGFPCYFGVRQYYNPLRYLKPDVMNWSSRSFLEVKPFSPSGIAKAGPQLAAYVVAYQASNFSPDTAWAPNTAIVLGTPTYFANAGGVVFYTDDQRAAAEWAALSLASAATIFRRFAGSTATRLGADAVARAALNNALRMLATANVGRISFQASTVVLTRF